MAGDGDRTKFSGSRNVPEKFLGLLEFSARTWNGEKLQGFSL
jgi:hypothetical protein